MRSVLGIDAAWSDNHASGIALAVSEGRGWRCLRVASSYEAFCRSAPERTRGKHGGHEFDARRVLDACRSLLGGAAPDLVAVDMPLARAPVVGRRPSDDAIARAFGHAKCSTHSPLPHRPGATGVRLQRGLERAGYVLRAAGDAPGSAHSIIEVYPHLGLLALMREPIRVPYKASKTTTYWKGEPLAERRRRLVDTWRAILLRLRRSMPGIPRDLASVDDGTPLASLKWREDAIDALVCAWMGARWLDGEAVPFGDDASAVWVPSQAMAFARRPAGTASRARIRPP